ncbi:sulfite exporter TauE/SafE family protein [Methylomonas sp. LL1]|uniref:sulfite exporter TauE/SafE family protein n=1 Tax=Methylomonas sp. LL1 TaxID=2785785 RepID=UPI0018C425AF|nr:sulfite exporter TauE/SafE family protein [Methylomonas sp. LL1]QPK63209.1 sulfite exporter TauE/SafE family protein [Methylomonas sp. LL1]
MAPEILITVAATAILQTLFGAGVLLFGTPILLLFGYEFVDVLAVLLPISLSINLMQIAKHRAHIDFSFYRNVLLLTLPPIAIFLFLVTHARINIGIVIGVFLLLIALKEFSEKIARMINSVMEYEKPYFVAMGVIHGLSNLGGSLLTALVHHKNYSKNIARATVAASYGTFALVQLLTLWLFSSGQIDISANENLIYLVIGVLVFGLTDEVLYARIDREKYRLIFSAFLALSGLVLIIKSVI